MAEEVKAPASTEEKIQEPLPSSMTGIAAGLIMLFIGSIISSNWAKETLINDVGFAMLLSGTGIFILGIFGTAITTLKNRLNKKAASAGIKISNQKVLFRSLWAVGIGIVLTFIGATVGNCYAKETMLNYAGFGMQLSGIALLVLGAFETARISANIYMNIERATKMPGVKKDRNFGERARNFWKYLVATHTLYNIAGIMVAMSLLFFSLWQLDLIVSGPVWWSDGGVGWSHPDGAYADQDFQCFLWKTTIGQAYDTLFLLIFISFIVLFVSVFFWRKRTD